MKLLPCLWSSILCVAALPALAQPATSGLPPSPSLSPSASPPLSALPALDVPGYMGTWYQVAWYPNRFQKQCLSDTTATYRRVPEGVEVVNRCRNAEGRVESITGLARPAGAEIRGDALQPAQLEVSFLPSWLRWLPIWGSYWVIQLADDGRYAVVSEPKREYLWVLSRTRELLPADESAIRSQLVEQGFDLQRLQPHAQAGAVR